MKVLILGGGGREHTLAWKVSVSPLVEEVFIMPGNPGTAEVGTNVAGDINDFAAVAEFVLSRGVEMVIVGPEEPLVRGIHDHFLEDSRMNGVSVIGPRLAGARLEGSKAFAKDFMRRNEIPTARFNSFSSAEAEAARNFLKEFSPPYVLKADGLAAGKGVLILDDLTEAEKETDNILLHGKFGQAGSELVIEEYLDGIEVSVFVVTDGTHTLMLPEAKDYKRIGEGDTGLNTGGMGSLSPVPFFDEVLKEKVQKRIIEPTIVGLQKENIPYSGFIFFGLMVVKGNPYMIEYNVRLGDPETESIIPRIENDLIPVLHSLKSKTLNQHSIEIIESQAATVMLVSGGYPGNYPKGLPIKGVDKISQSILFHAGTKITDGQLVTNGGRVFGVTTLAASLKDALKTSIDSAEVISYEGKYFRKDLGFDIL